MCDVVLDIRLQGYDIDAAVHVVVDEVAQRDRKLGRLGLWEGRISIS